MNTSMARCAVGLLLATVAALSPCSALCQNEKEAFRDMTVDELKRRYLSCDRAVMSNRLSMPAIRYCSLLYEELKWRAFDGDFEKLLSWSRSRSAMRDQ